MRIHKTDKLLKGGNPMIENANQCRERLGKILDDIDSGNINIKAIEQANRAVASYIRLAIAQLGYSILKQEMKDLKIGLLEEPE